MVSNHKELYQVVQSAAQQYRQQSSIECDFQLAKNGSCMLEHSQSKKRMVFMLAKLGEEQKVGFAFFEPNETQPDWIEDLPAGEFSDKTALQLIEQNLI